MKMKCKFTKYPQEGRYEITLECAEEFIKDFDKIYYGKLEVHPSNFGYMIQGGGETTGFLTLNIIVSTKE